MAEEEEEEEESPYNPLTWKWNFWDRERDPVKYWLCRIVVWIINIGLVIVILYFLGGPQAGFG